MSKIYIYFFEIRPFIICINCECIKTDNMMLADNNYRNYNIM